MSEPSDDAKLLDEIEARLRLFSGMPPGAPNNEYYVFANWIAPRLSRLLALGRDGLRWRRFIAALGPDPENPLIDDLDYLRRIADDAAAEGGEHGK